MLRIRQLEIIACVGALSIGYILLVAVLSSGSAQLTQRWTPAGPDCWKSANVVRCGGPRPRE